MFLKRKRYTYTHMQRCMYMCVHMYICTCPYINMHMCMHRCMCKHIYVRILETCGHELEKTNTNFYRGDPFRESGVRGRDIYRYYLISNHFLHFPLGKRSSPLL